MLAFTRVLDVAGYERTEAALQRALTTYAIARALNGVISVAQGTELAIEPAGIGVIFAPGEILDPVNDLIERFSWVMLVSSASLGIINILLLISSWVWLSIIMALGLMALVYLSWKKRQIKRFWSGVLLKLALIMVILRFAAPLMVLVNDFLYLQFLSPRYHSAVAELEDTRDKISEINDDAYQAQNMPEVERTLMEQARELYESTTQNIKRTLNLEEKMDNLSKATSEASRAAIDLIVIFIFQTIVLPVVFIWVIWFLLKQVIKQDFDSNSLVHP